MSYNISSQVMNFDNKSLYNPSCIKEMEKFQSFCLDFKADVLAEMNVRFKVVIITLAILIFIYFYIKRYEPKFSKTQFYINYLAYRLDFVIMIVTLIMIAYLFL